MQTVNPKMGKSESAKVFCFTGKKGRERTDSAYILHTEADQTKQHNVIRHD